MLSTEVRPRAVQDYVHTEWKGTEQGLLHPSFDVHTLCDLNADSLVWDIWKMDFLSQLVLPRPSAN